MADVHIYKENIMTNYNAVLYPNTTKAINLNFAAKNGKEAVKRIKELTEDDGAYFTLNECEHTEQLPVR